MKTREQIVERLEACKTDLEANAYGGSLNGVLAMEVLTLKYFFRFNPSQNVKFDDWAAERILMNDVTLQQEGLSEHGSLRARTESAILEWMISPV